MSKIGFKPVTMKDCCCCSCRSHQATAMMILQECIEKHGHPLIIIHILIMTQVSWHQFQSDALPMRKWDETQFTTKYPRQDETQVTTKYPRQDETQVTTKYPRQDETQFTTKYPRQDETQVTTKYPIQDETQVTTKYPRQDETHFTTKYPRQDETHFTTKYPRQDETQFTTKYPRQDETQVTKYWVFGPLTKNFSHPRWLAYNFSSPNHKHQNWYCRRWGRLPPNNRRLEQIVVPPSLSLLDGLVLLFNKT